MGDEEYKKNTFVEDVENRKKVLKIQHQTLKLKCKEKRFAVSKAGIHSDAIYAYSNNNNNGIH